MKKNALALALVSVFFLAFQVAFAQGESPDGPIYVVQSGDTLSIIAFRFAVSVDDLIEENQITNPNQLAVGDQLVIPGLPGVRGTLTTSIVPYGESLESLSRKYQMPEESLIRLNRLVSPSELNVGSQVILPVDQSESQPAGRALLMPGQSFLEAAVLDNSNPWTLAHINRFQGLNHAMPGDVFSTFEETTSGPGALPPSISRVSFSELPLVQGETATISIDTDEELQITAQFEAQDLRTEASINQSIQFFLDAPGRYIGLHGAHAMVEPGLYPFTLNVKDAAGDEFVFTQWVMVGSGGYGFDPPLDVDPKTVDSEVTGPEDEIWNALGRQVSEVRQWEGVFLSPSPFGDCWTSLYGSRRSYNGSPYNFFHTGLDFCGGVGIEVRAPASGTVTFADPLVVRGNAIMIDHGWGVHTGYMHLAEIMVQEGDLVEPGQLIGIVGGTGRVTGAHLHWEVWVSGVQVNPVDWLEEPFPLNSATAGTEG